MDGVQEAHDVEVAGFQRVVFDMLLAAKATAASDERVCIDVKYRSVEWR